MRAPRLANVSGSFVLAPAGAVVLMLALATFATRGDGRDGRDGADGGRVDSVPTRFATVDLYIDSGDVPLAAWQVRLADARGTIAIVGIEGGDDVFSEPPYYDERAMMRDTVILAAFSTADGDRLPRGRTRIATVHVEITGEADPQYTRELVAAAAADGRAIDATLTLGTTP
jgi:hypothetical protein